jgi:hypothetical protein
MLKKTFRTQVSSILYFAMTLLKISSHRSSKAVSQYSLNNHLSGGGGALVLDREGGAVMATFPYFIFGFLQVVNIPLEQFSVHSVKDGLRLTQFL